MKTKAPTLRQFLNEFTTEDSCLEHLMRTRYGDRHECSRCGRSAHFYRVRTRKVYSCEYCGNQVAPMADTPFARTRTPLRDWFHVMFLFCTTRNGVAAKEVERQLGVTYKTAWRMCHEIRKYMATVDGDHRLGGFTKQVEVDETIIGGKIEASKGALSNKAIVLGMLERGGNVVTEVVSDRRRNTLLPIIKDTVRPYSIVHTDEHTAYQTIGAHGYYHETVNHSAEQYVSPTGSSVNAIEGFWAAVKRGINGTHIHVSEKHLGEFEYRWNMRQRPHAMLDRLMISFAR
jgi:transposase